LARWTIGHPIQFVRAETAERFRGSFGPGTPVVNRFSECHPVEEKSLAFGTLVALEEIIVRDQVKRILAMGANNALGVISQITKSILVQLGEMIALAVFAKVVVALPEQSHRRAAMGAIHWLIFLITF
jgi:hypothetical protein